MCRAPHSVAYHRRSLKYSGQLGNFGSRGTTFPSSGHVVVVRRSSETSLTRRTAAESKPIILGLVACLALLLAPVPGASAVTAPATPVVSIQPPPRSEFSQAEPTVSERYAIASELIDNSSGDYNDNFAADAQETDTLDWACIRNAESNDNYRQVSGAYGIETSTWHQFGMTGVPGQASIEVQDHFALRLFAANDYRFAGTWNDVCTTGEGLR